MNTPQRVCLATVLCVVILLVFINERKQPPPPERPGMFSVAAPIETVNALFARKDIPRGTYFDSPVLIMDLTELKKNIPKHDLPRARVLSRDIQLKDLVALEDIARGEVLIGERFARPEEMGRVVSTEEPLR